MYRLFLLLVLVSLGVRGQQQQFCLLMTGNSEKVVGTISEANDKTFVSKQIALGNKYLKEGKLVESRKALQQVLDKFPENVDAMKKIAEVYVKLDQVPTAAEYYRLLHRTDTTNIGYVRKLAQLYEMSGRYLNATLAYEKVLKIDSNDLEALKQVARNYEQRKLRKDALLAYNRALKVYPEEKELLVEYGSLCVKHAKLVREGEAVFRKAATIYPEDADILENCGKLRFMVQDYSDAVGFLEQAKKFGELSYDGKEYLGISYYYQKDYEKSLSYLRECLQEYPSDEHVNYYIGLSYREKQDYHNSLYYLDRALDLFEDVRTVSDIYSHKGAVYMALLEFDKASEAFKEAYSLNKWKTEVLYFLGTSYDKMKKEDMALSYFQEYLDNTQKGKYIAKAKYRVKQIKSDELLGER